MKAFFNHYSLRFGIMLGWDFDEPYNNFAIRHKESYKSKISLTVGNTDVSEWDIFMLSLGKIVSPEAKQLLDFIVAKAHHIEEKMVTPIMISNHSGSSDYLLPFKVLREYTEYVYDEQQTMEDTAG